MSAATPNHPAPTTPDPARPIPALTSPIDLLRLVTTLLAPLFYELADNDLNHAYAAAAATINEYRAQTGHELLLIAQIIAFSLAGIATVVQSQHPDTPPQAALKAQTKANSLARTADTARKSLARSRRNPPPPPIDHEREKQLLAAVADLTAKPACTEAAPIAATALAPQAQPTSPRQAAYHTMLSNSFAVIAQEIAEGLPTLPPEDRHKANIQLSALTEVGTELRDTLDDRPA